MQQPKPNAKNFIKRLWFSNLSSKKRGVLFCCRKLYIPEQLLLLYKAQHLSRPLKALTQTHSSTLAAASVFQNNEQTRLGALAKWGVTPVAAATHYSVLSQYPGCQAKQAGQCR
nr:unnamed protein product [Callosobruchus analis]